MLSIERCGRSIQCEGQRDKIPEKGEEAAITSRPIQKSLCPRLRQESGNTKLMFAYHSLDRSSSRVPRFQRFPVAGRVRKQNQPSCVRHSSRFSLLLCVTPPSRETKRLRTFESSIDQTAHANVYNSVVTECPMEMRYRGRDVEAFHSLEGNFHR